MIISVTVCLMYPVFSEISINGKRGIKYTYFKLKISLPEEHFSSVILTCS